MVRVLVVDDDPMVRRLLGTILRAAGIEVAGEAADGDEVVPAVQAHHPDVLLTDLKMRRMGGVAAIAAVRALPHPPAIVALTAFDTPQLILDAVRAGADGFLAKDAAPDELVAAVRGVAAGDGALSARAARILVEYVQDDRSARERQEAQDRLSVLTDKEREIAAAVAEGLTNDEIAARAYVSPATVKTHLGRALTKLGLANRTQLALVVDRAGDGSARAD